MEGVVDFFFPLLVEVGPGGGQHGTPGREHGRLEEVLPHIRKSRECALHGVECAVEVAAVVFEHLRSEVVDGLLVAGQSVEGAAEGQEPIESILEARVGTAAGELAGVEPVQRLKAFVHRGLRLLNACAEGAEGDAAVA